MKIAFVFLVSLIGIQGYACHQNKTPDRTINSNIPSNPDTMTIKITVGTSVFTATLGDNKTAAAFKSRLPLTIQMTELNRNEKYGDLSENLPVNASLPGTIQNGDLMLYGSRTLVLFYKTFSTSYSYTRIGHVHNPSGLAAALGAGDVSVTFEEE